MTVDLRKDFVDTPTYKRAKKAVTSLREHIMRHMKATEVKIGKHLNLKMWERGMRNPAHKVTFIARKDDKGVVTAELANIPVKKVSKLEAKKAKEKQENKEQKKPAAKEEKAEARKTAPAAPEAKNAEAVPAKAVEPKTATSKK